MGKSITGQYGQYFTDLSECESILEIINNIKEIKGDVLEPSFGSGNFINKMNDYNINLDAVEIDKLLFNNLQTTNENISLYNEDFLDFEPNKKYDFIIGNPPYIELCYSFYDEDKKNLISDKYHHLTNGRINLVHIFFEKCFGLIEEDGIIAFLLPSAILTSPIYKKIRAKIFEDYTIEYLNEDIEFKNVAIKVSLLIIRKKKNNNDYFFINNDNYFIMKKAHIFENQISIKDEKFEVNIGNVVWNQKKEMLSDDNTNNMLIYSSNIGNDEIIYEQKRNRKQYITNQTIKHKNCIIFPRTISKKIKFAYVENNNNFIFENHVLVLTHNDKNKLDLFYKNLKDGMYDELLKCFFNSSNLTKTELLSLPFDV